MLCFLYLDTDAGAEAAWPTRTLTPRDNLHLRRGRERGGLRADANADVKGAPTRTRTRRPPGRRERERGGISSPPTRTRTRRPLGRRERGRGGDIFTSDADANAEAFGLTRTRTRRGSRRGRERGSLLADANADAKGMKTFFISFKQGKTLAIFQTHGFQHKNDKISVHVQKLQNMLHMENVVTIVR